MERYREYKPTSMQWLKEIPSHWEERRHKHCLLLVKNKSSLANKVGLENIESFSGRFIPTESIYDGNGVEAHEGDILYGKLRPYLAKVWIATGPCNAVGDFFVYRCNKKLLLNNYAKWLMLSDGFTKVCSASTYGAKMPRVSADFISSLSIPLPPLAEQEKIVSYLEGKTSKIDAYVAEKEKEILLLQELKQKTIADAVTKGLNPIVKMKDSGISWIGMIPEHWELRKLSQVSYEHYISNKDVHHQNLLSLSYGRIIRKDINTTEGLLPASFDTYQNVEEGNIVLRLTDLQNDHKSLRVGLVKEEGIVTSAYVCLGVYNSMIPSYLYNVLHSYDIKKLFYSMGGGLRQNLNWQGMKKIDIPLPPLNEQRAIVAYIEEKCQKIDTLMTELQAEIDYMKEYKQRLIADCVTGQVNVQNETI